MTRKKQQNNYLWTFGSTRNADNCISFLGNTERGSLQLVAQGHASVACYHTRDLMSSS